MHSAKYLMPVYFRCTLNCAPKTVRMEIYIMCILPILPHPSTRIFKKKKYRQTRKQSEKKLNK